jgi:hypothetical protein
MAPGGARLTSFRGALNSTTSVVLSGMERGETMEVALQAAKDAGIAEADPTGDLSGMDAAVKVGLCCVREVRLWRGVILGRWCDGDGEVPCWEVAVVERRWRDRAAA